MKNLILVFLFTISPINFAHAQGQYVFTRAMAIEDVALGSFWQRSIRVPFFFVYLTTGDGIVARTSCYSNILSGYERRIFISINPGPYDLKSVLKTKTSEQFETMDQCHRRLREIAQISEKNPLIINHSQLQENIYPD